MSEFISGKEAKIAWANGLVVQVDIGGGVFGDITGEDLLCVFDYTTNKFRLKPRTITLNGIEVPSVKYVAHSGGNCVKIFCECPEDAAAIGAALRSVFGKK